MGAMTSHLRAPSPVHPFPNEIFILILGFCSPATLAVCCRVSHEFLALASDPLRTTVRLTRPEQLELLFRVSPPDSLPILLHEHHQTDSYTPPSRAFS